MVNWSGDVAVLWGQLSAAGKPSDCILCQRSKWQLYECQHCMKDVVQSRIQSFPKMCSEKAQEGTISCQVTQAFWEKSQFFCWFSVLVRPLNTECNFLKWCVCVFIAFWNFTSLCQPLCEPPSNRTHHLNSTAAKIPDFMVTCMENTGDCFPQL